MGKGYRNQGEKKKWSVVTLLMFLAAVGVAGLLTRFAVAKYYAVKEQKGIAVASAFYFNSNLLARVAEGPATQTEIENIAGTLGTGGVIMYTSNAEAYGIPISWNEKKWTGGNYVFNLDIRNFDNNLLYNEAGLDLEYDVFFRVIGNGSGATYTVNKMGDSSEHVFSTIQTVKLSGAITGGSANSDVYEIHVNPTSTYNEDSMIFVAAYPTSPSYIKNDTSQKYRLFGLFRQRMTEPEMTVDGKFMLQNRNDYSGGWKNVVADYSGLIYTIQTGGDAVVDDNNSIKQDVYVTWNTQYLEISPNDKLYRDAKAKQTDPSYDWYTENTANHTATLKLQTLPNNILNITFYKTQNFIDGINGMSRVQFEQLVTASQ